MAGASLNVMIKRITIVFFAIVLSLSGLLCLPATAAITDPPAADVVVECDVAAVLTNNIVTVEVYLTDITRPYGILSCDLPLYYDTEYLEFVTVEGVFPKSWGGYGEYVGNSEFSETPVNGFLYLRAIPEAPDLEIGPTCKYNITADRALGFKVTFTALKEGVTKLEVKSDGANNILIVDSQTVTNYVANPASFSLTISSDKAVVDALNGKGDAPSEDVSSEVGDTSSESSDVDVSDGEISDIPESTEDADSTVDESFEESAESSDASAEDSSTEAVDSDVSESSDDVFASENIDNNPNDSHMDKSDSSEEGGNVWLTVFIIVGSLALVGAAVAVFYIFRVKKK